MRAHLDEPPRSIALALVPGTLLAGIAGGIVFPIFPIVGQRVGLPLPFIGMILAANRAVRFVAAPSVGALVDRIGGRRTMILGLFVQVVVAMLYLAGMVLHHEGAGFFVGRLLHGFGSACVFVSAQTLALHAAGKSNRGGSSAATVRVAIVLGVPIGFVAGGLLSDALGDVATFGVAAAAAALALVAAWASVPDLKAHAAAPRSLLVVLEYLRDRRLLAVGGLNFALTFAAGGMLLTTLALIVNSRHLTIFGLSARGTSGILMAVMSIADAACTPFLGRLGDRFHAHARVAAGALVSVTCGLLVIGLSAHTVGTAIGVALVGTGAAGLGPSALVLIGAIVPPENRGAGVGVMQLCGDVGGTLGPLVGTALFASSAAHPYFLTALVVACFVPVAVTLFPLDKTTQSLDTVPPQAPATGK